MDLISNIWKHLLRTETSYESLLKSFYFNNKGTRKVKDFQKLTNKEIYFTLQSNSTKCNKLFKLISWLNVLLGHHILSPKNWRKVFTDRFKKCFDGCMFSNPVMHRIGNAPNILCPKRKEREESHHHFMCFYKLSRSTLYFISELIHLNYSFKIHLKISLMAIIMGASSQFLDDVQLKLLVLY